jgi:hypothetical protein
VRERHLYGGGGGEGTKSITLFEGYQDTPARPSGSSSIKMKVPVSCLLWTVVNDEVGYLRREVAVACPSVWLEGVKIVT